MSTPRTMVCVSREFESRLISCLLRARLAGWTPLHYAALLSPPTLVSFLVTHGSDPLALTRRRLTPLDIVTAHSTVPGREDVAFLLEEAMREGGWKGGRMEDQRRSLEKRMRRLGKRRHVQEEIEKSLGISPKWWGDEDTFFSLESDEEGDEDALAESVLVSHPRTALRRVSQNELQTPPPDFSSMLVFSPMALPNIFQSLITDFPPSLRNAEPANTLYLLARFACLNCDHNWIEDLIIGATDTIEDVFFVSGALMKRITRLLNPFAEPRRGSNLSDLLVIQHHRLAASYAL